MTPSKKLVFFGNERLATGVSTSAPTLRALIDAGYEIAAVVSSYKAGVSRQKRQLEIAAVAEGHQIPVLLPDKIGDINDQFKSIGAECGILVAFGQIVPQSIIDLFPAGIVNIHPSLLPKYRGPTPVETAILDGVSETGVSLMSLSAKMDAGPVYVQQSVDLSPQETKQELADKLLGVGGQLLIDNLPLILSGELKPVDQNHEQASYTNLLKKDDGIIDWGESAETIERKVRAFQIFPKSRAEIQGKSVVITGARVAENSGDGHLVMRCDPGWLEITELIAPSGRSMSGADFLRGLRG